jgi:hypothetical protein
VVRVPASSNETAKPAVRAKFPPRVIGSTTGVLVNRLNGAGEIINTAHLAACFL